MLFFHEMIVPLLLGLALFLFGMKTMEASLQSWAGPRLIKFLHSSTRTPLTGLLSSTAITAALQSSTATTVMTVGLVNAGLLNYARTLGIILGGNIGTCLTTELIALDITSLGVPMFILSLILWAISVIAYEYMPAHIRRNHSWLHSVQYISLAILGFSLIMIAIAWMKSIGTLLEEQGVIQALLTHAGDSILWGAAAGAAVTALIHSSAAAIAITMGLVASGVLPLELGIAMVIGSNVGTCVTAWIASLGGTRPGQFVAWSHIVLNVLGALLFLPLIPLLQAGAAWLSGDLSQQIAHVQTIFNVASSLLALPFCYLPVWNRLDAKTV